VSVKMVQCKCTAPHNLLTQRSSASRQGSSRLPSVSPLPNVRFGAYRAFVTAKVARGIPVQSIEMPKIETGTSAQNSTEISEGDTGTMDNSSLLYDHAVVLGVAGL